MADIVSWVFTGVMAGLGLLAFLAARYLDKKRDKNYPPRPALSEPANFEEFAPLYSLRSEDSPDLKWVLARDGKYDSFQLVEGSRLFATYRSPAEAGLPDARSHDGEFWIHTSLTGKATIESFQTGAIVTSVVAEFKPTRSHLGFRSRTGGILEFRTGFKCKWENDGWLAEAAGPSTSNNQEFLVRFESPRQSVLKKPLVLPVMIGKGGFLLKELPILAIFGFCIALRSLIDRDYGSGG
jgi:hypothetical protein